MIQSTDSVAYIYIFHVPMYIQSIFKELNYKPQIRPPPELSDSINSFLRNGPFALDSSFILLNSAITRHDESYFYKVQI